MVTEEHRFIILGTESEDQNLKSASCSVLTMDTILAAEGERGEVPVVEPRSAIMIEPPDPAPVPSPLVSQTRNS